MTSKIFAVIVTYNRKELLENTLKAVQSQTENIYKIVVVNNCSTDGTHQLLENASQADPKLQVLNLKENIGGAGGFSEGIKYAYKDGADFVWIMDDDCEPKPNALKSLTTNWDLLTTQNIEPGFICSKVIWKDDSICEMNQPSPTWDWARHQDISKSITKVDCCSFVSVLFSRNAIQSVGLPISDFFIWYDDVEYTKRISKKYPCFIDSNSIVAHLTPENKGVWFALVNDANKWKYMHGARNQGWHIWHHDGGKLSWLSFVIGRLRDMRIGKVPLTLQARMLVTLLKSPLFRPRIDSDLHKH
ncbi:glycosyl transferase [Microbulbifer sp. A4B17]|uniref:glycosyltransferase family 2 protein n=1 Tax=Microbulbifer sp. A4B17 TaxID=359370 RepID=UPI000D52D9E2|nr:glycosyltransferase family 2 protein [Microbulbifer sp. A4B17]AWF81870.1 glycosyl transferase [Microbulbifer sp. A4B17]